MSELLSAVGGYVDKATDWIKSNLGSIAVGAGGLALGAGIGAAAATKISNSVKSGSSKRKSRRKKSSSSKKRSSRSNRRNRRKRYTPHTAGKGKDTSHRRIRYTKNGQPYIILGSGKARFIKKRGSRSSHKRAGGRY